MLRLLPMLFVCGCYVQEMRGPLPGCETSECKQQRAAEAIEQFAEAAEGYLREHGELPATLEALTGDAPLDPWGNPYLYRRIGERALLISLGHGGARGGVGADEDLWRAIPRPVAPGMQR